MYFRLTVKSVYSPFPLNFEEFKVRNLTGGSKSYLDGVTYVRVICVPGQALSVVGPKRGVQYPTALLAISGGWVNRRGVAGVCVFYAGSSI